MWLQTRRLRYNPAPGLMRRRLATNFPAIQQAEL
jgi:hypothetical protein